ncbi:hypothetical protein [Opitutus sp. GAS368]|uniref:hypothetical protein n=1 Tax=Opitutus sp. GAS368 TaxID=1882749 RepID=UPI000B8A0FEC|nr:hypothetical protein [Opitutus sp. GAS368]
MISILTVATLSAFATMAMAAGHGGGGGGGAGVGAGAAMPAFSHGPAITPAVGANTPAVGASAGGSMSAHASPEATEAKGSDGLNANATTHASAEGQANGLAVAAVASDRTRDTVRMDETVEAIHAAKFTDRDQVTTDIKARLDESDKLVADLRLRAAAAGDKSQAAFAKALVEVREQEKQVRISLKAATKAKDAATWGSVQSDLAKSYGAYAHALAEAAVAAQVTPAPKS